MLVGYIRVSTDDQNLSLQKDALLKYGVDERNIFSDKTSGSKDKRVGLDKALEFLKDGDTLVVWKLDRLGRSLAHLISVITDLKSKNISFVSITEGMDTTTASGELFFHIFGALAQFERSLIQERVKAGLEAAKNRGIGYLGTFGKNATKNFKLTLKSDTLLYEPLELIFPYKDTLSTPKTISSSIS